MMTARLYRCLAAGLTILLTLPTPAFAQLRTSKPKKSPRAIAVVRWQTGAQGKAVPRLLPVAILEDGKYHDASLYRATPRPMALEPGVVYEAQDKGEVLGYFTVKSFGRNTATRQWFGLGEWESTSRGSTELALRERPQSTEIVKDKKAGTSPIFTEPVDDRDIKKKTTVYDEEGREIPEGQVPADDKLPSLKRQQGDIERLPQVAPPEKKKPETTTADPDDDPERPRLKRGGAEAAPADAPSGAVQNRPMVKSGAGASVDDDPNRPILRRGGGQQKTASAEGSAGTTVPGRVQARGDVASGAARQESGFATRTFEAVAISDAEDTGTKLDYRFRWSESEREELTQKMRRLAQLEAERFLKASGLNAAAAAPASTARTSPAKRQTIPAPVLTLVDRQMAGLDLDFNNSAELVYAGSATLAAGKTLFVTVVARTDIDGNPRRLHSVVTASDRLDVSPRLELVDAVDADGDGRAELLFRRLGERAAEFVIYRVGPDALAETFRGGAAE